MAKYFVPHYLGLNHMTRRNVIEKHTSYVASRLLMENRNSCILVLDGTYLYIQVSSPSCTFSLLNILFCG